MELRGPRRSDGARQQDTNRGASRNRGSGRGQRRGRGRCRGEEECNCWGAGSGALVGAAAMQRGSGAMTPGAGGFWGRRGEALQKERRPMTRCGHGTRASFGLWGLDVFQKASRNRPNLLRSCRHPRAPTGTPSASSQHYPLRLLAGCCRPGCCHWLPLRHTSPRSAGALPLWCSGALACCHGPRRWETCLYMADGCKTNSQPLPIATCKAPPKLPGHGLPTTPSSPPPSGPGATYGTAAS
jgi:hypothetical protein